MYVCVCMYVVSKELGFLYSLRFKIKVTFGHKLRYEVKVTFGESSLKLRETNWNVVKIDVNVLLLMNYQV